MKRTPIRKVSKRRSKELREYSKLRKEFLKRFSLCEAHISIQHTSINVKSQDIHHMDGRNNWRLNNIKNWLPVSRPCHEFLHANIKWAMEHGFIEKIK